MAQPLGVTLDYAVGQELAQAIEFLYPQLRSRNATMSAAKLGRDPQMCIRDSPATALERFREEVLVAVEGWDQPSWRYALDLGCTFLISCLLYTSFIFLFEKLGLDDGAYCYRVQY